MTERNIIQDLRTQFSSVQKPIYERIKALKYDQCAKNSHYMEIFFIIETTFFKFFSYTSHTLSHIQKLCKIL